MPLLLLHDGLRWAGLSGSSMVARLRSNNARILALKELLTEVTKPLVLWLRHDLNSHTLAVLDTEGRGVFYPVCNTISPHY
jgi:hypothetical protein